MSDLIIDWQTRLHEGFHAFAENIATLVSQPAVTIADACVPSSSGVYLFLFEDEITYVGEAKGRGGLEDRICRKHVSGDDSHAIQRQFKARFPDRNKRREFIRNHVHVKWVVIDDSERIAVVERLGIWLFSPKWNML